MTFFAFTPWQWLGMAVILFILEISVSGGGFLLWVGLSSLAISIILWIFPGLLWGTQVILFSVLAVLASVLWWAYLKKNPLKTADSTLNRRSEQYVGRTFTLSEPILNGRGKIHVEDSTWTVKGPDLPLGAKVMIVRAEGTILIAEPVSLS